jgi:hypothetical protein
VATRFFGAFNKHKRRFFGSFKVVDLHSHRDQNRHMASFTGFIDELGYFTRNYKICSFSSFFRLVYERLLGAIQKEAQTNSRLGYKNVKIV